MKNKCILGIDTSNYRTSVALIDLNNNIITSKRQLLEVKKGDRGLQQSSALFQHLQALPNLIEDTINDDLDIVCVACSSRPRPVEGSYMPVFVAGQTVAKSISASLGVPYYEFSHQEGHIQAAKHGTKLEHSNKLIAFHFSGGTTECLLYDNGKIQIVGGTLDLAFGQIVDRVGVKLGYGFPAGVYLDELLLNSQTDCSINNITHVKVKDSYFNLSGLETQLYKLIDNCEKRETIVKLTFDEIALIVNTCMKQLSKQYGVYDFLFAGGVSSSEYLRKKIDNQYNCYFASEELSGDNAVGIALLGGKQYGKKASHNNTTE